LKISEFIATGRVAKIAAQTTEDLAVTRLFQGVYGVGPQTAHSWYVRGLRTLTDIRNRMDGIVLSPAQELGLQYYTDLQRRMPRSEAAEIFQRIKAVGVSWSVLFIE
jgi:DNA polymerase lambda